MTSNDGPKASEARVLLSLLALVQRLLDVVFQVNFGQRLRRVDLERFTVTRERMHARERQRQSVFTLAAFLLMMFVDSCTHAMAESKGHQMSILQLD